MVMWTGLYEAGDLEFLENQKRLLYTFYSKAHKDRKDGIKEGGYALRENVKVSRKTHDTLKTLSTIFHLPLYKIVEILIEAEAQRVEALMRDEKTHKLFDN